MTSNGARRRLLITGPPGSGTSTLARQLAGPGTVVIDFDALAAAFGSVVDHHTEPHQRQHVAAARVAWVGSVRAALAGELGGDLIVIQADPPEWQRLRWLKAGYEVLEC
jgi:broad-specificity NMP kinase